MPRIPRLRPVLSIAARSAAIVAFGAVLVAAGTARAADQALIDAAKKEGEVVITRGATAELIPGARHAILPATGHACCIEDPAGFDARVTGFLASIGRLPADSP